LSHIGLVCSSRCFWHVCTIKIVKLHSHIDIRKSFFINLNCIIWALRLRGNIIISDIANWLIYGYSWFYCDMKIIHIFINSGNPHFSSTCTLANIRVLRSFRIIVHNKF
jgi:hypothetical protein